MNIEHSYSNIENDIDKFNNIKKYIINDLQSFLKLNKFVGLGLITTGLVVAYLSIYLINYLLKKYNVYVKNIYKFFRITFSILLVVLVILFINNNYIKLLIYGVLIGLITYRIFWILKRVYCLIKPSKCKITCSNSIQKRI